jgi:predicted phosphohydrolase
MNIWAIADLHLPFGDPSKSMEIFGTAWENYTVRLQTSWDSLVKPEDLVLIAGDVSWAMRLEQALPDLQWIHERPGTKVLIRGNHDYWWSSATKIRSVLPSSLHIIHNDVFTFQNIAIAGTRLWNDPTLNFAHLINSTAPFTEKHEPEDLAIFHREIERLKLSLSKIPKDISLKIAMTHFPPIGNDLLPSTASTLLEEHGINIVVFGHLHALKPNIHPFGTARNVQYLLTSCDFLQCTPLKVM